MNPILIALQDGEKTHRQLAQETRMSALSLVNGLSRLRKDGVISRGELAQDGSYKYRLNEV